MTQVLIALHLAKKNFLTIVLLKYLINLMLLVTRWFVCTLQFLIFSEQNVVAIAKCCNIGDTCLLCCVLARLHAVWFGCAVVSMNRMDSEICDIFLS